MEQVDKKELDNHKAGEQVTKHVRRTEGDKWNGTVGQNRTDGQNRPG